MSRPRTSSHPAFSFRIPPPDVRTVQVEDVLLVRRVSLPLDIPVFGWVNQHPPVQMLVPALGFERRGPKSTGAPYRSVPIRPDWLPLAVYRSGVLVASVAWSHRDLNPPPPNELPPDWLTYTEDPFFRRLARVKLRMTRFWPHGWRLDWTTGWWSKKTLDISATVRYMEGAGPDVPSTTPTSLGASGAWAGWIRPSTEPFSGPPDVVVPHASGGVSRDIAAEFRAVAMTHQKIVSRDIIRKEK